MDPENISERAERLADEAERLSERAEALAGDAARLVIETTQAQGLDPFIFGITVLVLAIFVGYYVVWRVTPALHSPLMAVTNAVSSVIIVGALIAAGPAELSAAKILGFLAVILASVNIFGGFIVTQRMLQMFRKKQR
jgi:H+-translocating NAD(P) transhydrogenase subunit alpha